MGWVGDVASSVGCRASLHLSGMIHSCWRASELITARLIHCYELLHFAVVHWLVIAVRFGSSLDHNPVFPRRFLGITHSFNKPFIIWLLDTSPHLKYVATLPWNLSLMACFADTNVSQRSVATYAKSGGILNVHLTANLQGNHPVETIFKSVMIWQNIVVMSLSLLFWPTLYNIILTDLKKIVLVPI